MDKLGTATNWRGIWKEDILTYFLCPIYIYIPTCMQDASEWVSTVSLLRETIFRYITKHRIYNIIYAAAIQCEFQVGSANFKICRNTRFVCSFLFMFYKPVDFRKWSKRLIFLFCSKIVMFVDNIFVLTIFFKKCLCQFMFYTCSNSGYLQQARRHKPSF